MAESLEYDQVDIIYHGDCRDIIKKFSNESIDLILTSPPYFNIAKKYQRGSGIHYSQDVGEPLYVIEDLFEESKRILKPEGFFCINLGFSYGETGVLRPFYVIERALKQGLFIIDTIIWHKNNPIPIQGRLTNSFEYIFVLAKHPSTKYPSYYRIGYKHNFFNAPVNKKESSCSSPFPVELAEFCIDVFSNIGDIVLDPMAGSGTSLAVAKKMSRNYIGIDINIEYCKFMQQRLGCLNFA